MTKKYPIYLIIAVCLFTFAAETQARRGGAYDLETSLNNYPASVISTSTQANYSVLVENIGSTQARNTDLRIDLSPFVVPAASLDNRCVVDAGNFISCQLGTLGSGQFTQVIVDFDITAAGSYQFSATASARKSDANNGNNQVQNSFDAETPVITPYVWNAANNVLVSNTTNYTNGSSGTGRSYGTLYAPDQNGNGVGVIDGIFSSYSLDINAQTIDIVRGVFPGTDMASGAQAIDAVSYQTIETAPSTNIINRETLVCLYEPNAPAYVHPYPELFPLQSSRQAQLTINNINAWNPTTIVPKSATFHPGGVVNIDNVNHSYTADRDSLKIFDGNNSLIYYAVRTWSDRYMDFSPANFDSQTGTGSATEIIFSP